MIKINNLSKSYAKTPVLNSLNVEFLKGQVYGIVGENGAGKTTLFRCIAGLETYQGQITSDIGYYMDRLGLLMTEPFFFSKMTGKEYIRLLTNARKINLTNIENKNIFGLPINQYVSTYSTGMKKKLAITAILLQENDFYILDEPFNGVDQASNLLLTEIIKELKAMEKTIIISSHLLSSLKEICDNIFLLKHGQIKERFDRTEFSDLEKKMKNTVDKNLITDFFRRTDM